VLYREPKLLKFFQIERFNVVALGVSVLYREPKLLKSCLTRYGDEPDD
jgi:hypothetical protein